MVTCLQKSHSKKFKCCTFANKGVGGDWFKEGGGISTLLEISCKILERIWQESVKIFEHFLHILKD